MAETGRGNVAIDTLPAELRATVDALLDAGQAPADVHRGQSLAGYLALRTFQEYARERRLERRRDLAREAIEFYEGLLAELKIDAAALDQTQRLMMGAALSDMCLSDKASSRINALRAALDIREDQRSGEAHGLRMRIEAAKAAIEKASTEDGAGRRVVDLAAVAEAMEKIDLSR